MIRTIKATISKGLNGDVVCVMCKRRWERDEEIKPEIGDLCECGSVEHWKVND